MNRRTLLTTIGIPIPLATGGCLSFFEDTGEAAKIQLGYLDVANFDTTSHRFEVRVFKDGERVHSSSHEVQSRDGATVHGTAVDCTWDENPGEYAISARVDDEEWNELSLTPDNSPVTPDTECAVVGVLYRDNEVMTTVSSGCDRDYDGMCPFAAAVSPQRADRAETRRRFLPQ